MQSSGELLGHPTRRLYGLNALVSALETYEDNIPGPLEQAPKRMQ